MLITTTLFALAGASQGLAFPPPIPQPSIEWSTLDAGGGEVSSGGGWELTGTIGQPDAQRYVGGGAYSVTGGFWEGGALANVPISDLNGDGAIDLQDFFDFLNYFDTTDYGADINRDGVVDLADFFEFLNAFDGSY